MRQGKNIIAPLRAVRVRPRQVPSMVDEIPLLAVLVLDGLAFAGPAGLGDDDGLVG